MLKRVKRTKKMTMKVDAVVAMLLVLALGCSYARLARKDLLVSPRYVDEIWQRRGRAGGRAFRALRL